MTQAIERVDIAVAEVKAESPLWVRLRRVNGDFPSENTEIISTCRCWDIHRFLKIDSPAQLQIKRGDTITLHHETGALEWERVDIADAVLLHALRDHPLEKSVLYEIVKQGDGPYAIQQSRTKKQ